MPTLETMDLPHYAVLFPRVGMASRIDGQPVVSAAGTQIRVRWNDSRVQRLLPDGTTVIYDGDVTCSVDVPDESILWRGKAADLPANGIPTSGLVQVKSFDATDELKGRVTRRELLFIRYNNKLPVA